MTAFLLSLAVLVGGYAIYGAFIARYVFPVDASRPTPALTRTDGVDYTPMATWRVFLIQFLNIAGLGPIFGAIMGVMFGPAAFLWIVLGTIFAGAVHDFLSAMMSLRAGGASLPEIIGEHLGTTARNAMRVLSVVLLVLVGAVFIITPAGLLAQMTPAWLTTEIIIGLIFLYYLLATLLPIDKLIGRFYPIFGFALLFMALGLLCAMAFGGHDISMGLEDGLWNRHASPERYPIFPMIFVSIACGAISGFHATQSPMMARCLKSERLARPVFYGAMVAEGIVALIWAAGAIAFTGGYEQLTQYMSTHTPGQLVHDVSFGWLGVAGGILAVLGVVAAPITTGDTALRSARLTIADFLGMSQKTLRKRLIITLPLFLLTFGVMMIDFNVLWRYFAWTNQLLATITLWAITVCLARRGPWYWVTLVPALFLTVVCAAYILFAPSPEGLGLPLAVAVGCGLAVAAGCGAFFFFRVPKWTLSAN